VGTAVGGYTSGVGRVQRVAHPWGLTLAHHSSLQEVALVRG
jgi:hypothetical protein